MADKNVISKLLEKGKIIEELALKEFDLKPDNLLKKMMMEYFKRGGKRLRPVLCMTVCEAFGEDVRKSYNTAIALEIFQQWILIHDDIEDYSDERRGKPCLHRIYGVPLAANTGDALHIMMWDALLKNKKTIGEEKCYKVMKEFVSMATECTSGQSKELEWVGMKEWNITENDYYEMAKRKTSWYTIITPCRLGAVIGGASDEQLDAFNSFGENLGIAFQIEDDLLNIIGDEKKYGKEIAGDIWEGKRTLMLIHLANNASPDERKKIIEIMNKKREDKKSDEISYVLELMHKHNSISHAKEKAKEFARKGKAIFEKKFGFLKESEAKSLLRGVVDFVADREL